MSFRRDPEAGVTAALLCLAGGALLFHARFLAVPLVDDAAISLDYGRTLFEGHGFRLTPASQVVEAFSNPLWTVIGGLHVPLGLDGGTFVQRLGLLCALLSLGAFALWGPWAEGRALRLEDALPAGLACGVTSFAYWSASGMESGLQSLLLGLAGACWLRERRLGRGALTGLWLGLLCLVRPEALLLAAAWALAWIAGRALERKAPGRQELWLAGAFLLVVGGYELVRLAVFARPLPNSFYVKQHWSFDGPGYLAGFARAHAALLALALVGLLAAPFGGAGPRTRALLTGTLLAVGVGFVAWSGGDWMREWRFLGPLVPALGAAAASGVSALRARLPGAIIGRTVASAALGVLAIFGVLGARERSPEMKRSPELPARYIGETAAALEPHLERLGMRRPLIAFPDLGGLGQVRREAEVIDVAGLGDLALAFHAQNLDAEVDYLISEGPPSYLDVHGPSIRFAPRAELMSRYLPLRSASPSLGVPPFFYVLRGLSADDDPRCPGSKGEVLALSAEALAARISAQLEEGKGSEAIALWRCAFAYQPEERLPSPATRRTWVERALAASDRVAPSIARLRLLSFAAIASGGDPHLRLRAERLRAELFRPPR